MFGDEWPSELPLTQKEALEFAERLKIKVGKYPDKTPFDCYLETKFEMGFDKKQSIFMDIIMESFFKYIEEKEGLHGKINRTSSTKPKTP